MRHAHIPVLELSSDKEASYSRVHGVCKQCLDEDGADTLILGCMSMAFLGVSDRLQEDLCVPVVNPAYVTLKFAELLAGANLTSSPVAYPAPPNELTL